MDKKNSLISIDLLRFFAAFAVYYYHQHIGSILAKYTQLYWLTYTDFIGANYAVPLFFLISGFCIHLSMANKGLHLDIKKYYIARLWRLYPTYLVALLLSILLIWIITAKPVPIQDLMTHLFILQGFSETYFNTINVILWTITIELVLYLAYPLFYFIYRKSSIHTALAFTAIITIISIITCMLNNEEISLPDRYFFTNLWFAWCFGAWLCEIYLKKPNYFKTSNWYIVSIVLFGLFFLSFFLSWENDILIKSIIYVCFWAPILIYLILNEDYLIKHKIWLKIPIALGLSSYSLYLFHDSLIMFKNYFIHLFIVEEFQFFSMFLGIFIIPLFCYWNYLFIEKRFMNMRPLKHLEVTNGKS